MDSGGRRPRTRARVRLASVNTSRLWITPGLLIVHLSVMNPEF